MIRGHLRGNTNHQKRNGNKSEQCKIFESSNPIIKFFRVYASELDDKHDRFERIVNHSHSLITFIFENSA